MTYCDPTVLSRYLDGDLSTTERRRMNTHLRTCEACANELVRLRRLDDMLRVWGARRTPLPVAADRRIAEAVRQRHRKSRLRSFFAVGRMAPAAVGSSVAAVLLLLSVHMHVADPSRSASETAWITQQSSIKRQAAPLLKARRSSAILGGQVKVDAGTLGRPTDWTLLN